MRLITKGKYDWSKRYPWIVESALRLRQQQFMIDGEVVVLNVDGTSDFQALHSRKIPKRSSMPSTFWRLAVMIIGACRCRCASRTSPGYSRAAPMASMQRPMSRVRSDPTCFVARVFPGWKVWFRNIVSALMALVNSPRT